MALKVVALAGGVGGAKLADGLAQAMPARDLTIVVNTGDDFDHLGLRICPDLDTMVYTLAGLADPRRGWGRADETWHFLEELGRLGGPVWFRLGDRDLALHAERTRRLGSGETLSEVTQHFCQILGVEARVLPMSDQPVETKVMTEDGRMPFEEYFVARKWKPVVKGFLFEGVEASSPAPGVLQAIQAADLVVLCPSNPWVSLDPILAVPGIREALHPRPVLGVSPIIGNQAVKGPAAKMFLEMGMEPTAYSAAAHFRDLLQGWVIDNQDGHLEERITELGVQVWVSDILMVDDRDRRRLGAEALRFGAELRSMEGM
ncbi:MAG TPA: 2-phospho-L-lactate transferase [Anaerolineae bacterium]|nr:2-phospho-L-lactate transferase [Anaerolineae bacterium]